MHVMSFPSLSPVCYSHLISHQQCFTGFLSFSRNWFTINNPAPHVINTSNTGQLLHTSLFLTFLASGLVLADNRYLFFVCHDLKFSFLLLRSSHVKYNYCVCVCQFIVSIVCFRYVVISWNQPVFFTAKQKSLLVYTTISYIKRPKIETNFYSTVFTCIILCKLLNHSASWSKL